MYTENDYAEQLKSVEKRNTDDYADLLKSIDVPYTQIDYFLQVGNVSKTQGWVLHISTVISQIQEVFDTIIPELISLSVPFKIPANKETARALLNGNMGESKIGKVISIYSNDETDIVRLAKKMISLTKNIKGPQIPTDVHLGGAVYTRYGSINPILIKDATGKKESYIYNKNGELIKDEYLIPFQLPSDVIWPYSEITNMLTPPSLTVLKNIYKPIAVLKANVRGNVLKGIYVKNWILTAPCVIKQGIRHMISEDNGRDIRDRLEWQFRLHKSLETELPLPKVLDLIEENGDTYLIMDYVKGTSFLDKLKEINYNSKSWRQLSGENRKILVSYLLKIITVIELLHNKGYIHRDIAPGNFMIDKKDKVILIDVELAYSVNQRHPNPPFELGTEGYMSPEQRVVAEPTFMQDVYGIGALILTVFTGLSPMKFDTTNPTILIENLDNFIDDIEVAALISACLSRNPISRPNLASIFQTLQQYAENRTAKKNKIPAIKQLKENTLILSVIQSAINGLTSSYIAWSNEYWYSKNEGESGFESAHQKEYSRYGGLYKGMTGVLYLVPLAKRSGISISRCHKSYLKGWDYIHNTYFKDLSQTDPGLYAGAAGMAISMVIGIQEELLENTIVQRNLIVECLSIPTKNLTLAYGISGRGVATLICMPYIDNQAGEKLLREYISTLLGAQQKDGSWITSPAGNGERSLSLGIGTPGIILFLLQYIYIYKDEKVKESAIRGLNWIKSRTSNLQKIFDPSFLAASVQTSGGLNDEQQGCILLFIKAYEVLSDDMYMRISEDALERYPEFIVNNNYSLGTGMAALGEIYLQAFSAFKTIKWKERSDWIANSFISTMYRPSEDIAYWNMDETGKSTADLMVGCGGIIHFLIRYSESMKQNMQHK